MIVLNITISMLDSLIYLHTVLIVINKTFMPQVQKYIHAYDKNVLIRYNAC